VDFLVGEINHNFPYRPSLKPNDSLVFNAYITKRDNTLGQHVETTKFGFILIDYDWSKDAFFYDEIINDKSKYDKIFWSNPLYLENAK
jgi:hypothetical protein